MCFVNWCARRQHYHPWWNVVVEHLIIKCHYALRSRYIKRTHTHTHETTATSILSVSKIYGEMSFVRLRYHYFYFCRHLFHHQDTQNESIVTMRSISFVISFRHSFGVTVFFFSVPNDDFASQCRLFTVCIVFDSNTSTDQWNFANHPNVRYKKNERKKINFVYLLRIDEFHFDTFFLPYHE